MQQLVESFAVQRCVRYSTSLEMLSVGLGVVDLVPSLRHVLQTTKGFPLKCELFLSIKQGTINLGSHYVKVDQFPWVSKADDSAHVGESWHFQLSQKAHPLPRLFGGPKDTKRKRTTFRKLRLSQGDPGNVRRIVSGRTWENILRCCWADESGHWLQLIRKVELSRLDRLGLAPWLLPMFSCLFCRALKDRELAAAWLT